MKPKVPLLNNYKTMPKSKQPVASTADVWVHITMLLVWMALCTWCSMEMTNTFCLNQTQANKKSCTLICELAANNQRLEIGALFTWNLPCVLKLTKVWPRLNIFIVSFIILGDKVPHRQGPMFVIGRCFSRHFCGLCSKQTKHHLINNAKHETLRKRPRQL